MLTTRSSPGAYYPVLGEVTGAGGTGGGKLESPSSHRMEFGEKLFHRSKPPIWAEMSVGS
jgi:hypothetical protein